LVIDILGNAVHFIFAVVDGNLWIRDRYYIDLTLYKLLLEDRALLDAYVDLQLYR